MNIQFTVLPGGKLQGLHRVPGDKSISHRAIMLGALADGTTEVTGFLEGEDTLATLAAFQAMGVPIEKLAPGHIIIQGVGLQGLKQPSVPLNLGNSGTSMRLLAGLMAGQAFSVEIVGDASLSKRPMQRVTEPLSQMGAIIETSGTGTSPLKIKGHQSLRGINYVLPVASAQIKSCLLLAGLYAQGVTCVTEPAPTRDHTERMLTGFGYPVEREEAKVCINGGHHLQATAVDVPADISSAAFFMVGASIANQADVILQHVGINPTRTGIIDILRQMGADITLYNSRTVSGEPVADIQVRSANLKGITIPEHLVPLAIDEFPAIFIVAACAQGKTVLTGAKELRVKESDRIQVMADGLQAVGIHSEPLPDGIIIHGGQIRGGEVNSHGDHRIAMAFTMAALRAQEKIVIQDCANVATSFPNFIGLVQAAGLQIEENRLST